MEHLIHSDDTGFEHREVKGSAIDALWQDLGRAAHRGGHLGLRSICLDLDRRGADRRRL